MSRGFQRLIEVAAYPSPSHEMNVDAARFIAGSTENTA